MESIKTKPTNEAIDFIEFKELVELVTGSTLDEIYKYYVNQEDSNEKSHME